LDKFFHKYFYFIAAGILVLASVNLFYKLGTTTVQDWDEVRHVSKWTQENRRFIIENKIKPLCKNENYIIIK
jgi:hypothetical protein